MADYSYRSWLAFLFIAAVGACATVDEPEQTGFLSDYSKLERDTDNYWRYVGPKFGEYSTFYVESVAFLIEQKEDPVFSPDDIEELKQYVITRLSLRLSEDDGYEVVFGPGPGVASLRMGITDVDASIAALNLAIYTRVTGAGLGGIAAEGEIVDSMTGEQLAAAIRWGSGRRVRGRGKQVLEGEISKLADAKGVIDHWAKDIRQRIDKAHGR
ncbi:MAG: DUF3313 family protein [Woeseiaceae bacterium]|nr:DUF3313 family protein [Woeseiaceae bacterium]